MSDEQIDPELKSTLTWAKKTSEANPPPGLETRILARLEAEQRQKSRRPWMWGLSGGFVTAVVATFVFFGLHETPRERAEGVAKIDMAELKQAPATKSQLGMAFKAERAEEKPVIMQDRRLQAKDSTALRGMASGDISVAATHRVIRTQEEWAPFDADGNKHVDFSQRMVLVLFDGKIVSHKIEDGKLVVRYKRQWNTSPSKPTQMLTVPLFDGPVEFRLVN